MKNSKNLFSTLAVAVSVIAGGFLQISCLDEQHPGSYYTFEGETVASFLENREDLFSDFIYCLKESGVWGEMRTYGEHTCFAPTNEAMKTFLSEKGISSVTQLTKEECDTIAKTHLCNATFFCKDLQDGAFPYPNLLDRYLTYSTDSAINENGAFEVVYKVNTLSSIIERDDTVTNGVVHIVDRVVVPSNRFLPDRMEEDPLITIFNAALALTQMNDSLIAYMDPTYVSPAYDSLLICFKQTGRTAIRYSTGYETENGTFPDKRYFKFTAFVEPDSIFIANGINNLEELRKKAEEWYANGHDEYYDDPTDRRNSLNKFVSYHLLPMELSYNQLTTSQDYIKTNFVSWDAIDIEDWYETMMPHSVMRISYPKSGDRFINRKGAPKAARGIEFKGVRIWSPAERTDFDQTALNGQYHLLDEILLYTDEVRQNNLNTRMRIMCNTMSPDFINSGARGRFRATESDRYTTGFKKGFCKNVEYSDETQLWVRYRDQSFSCFLGDEMTIRGIYDVTFRLPPVPNDGTYEIRMFECTLAGSAYSDRGVVQIYFKEGDGEFQPCGIPVDLTLDGNNPKVGWIADSELSGESEILANEKAMRNRGYMKAMDSYTGSGSGNLRERSDCLRKILTNDYMYANKDYYIRIRLVLDNPTAVCPFNVIEIVPKSVYLGEIPEDRH